MADFSTDDRAQEGLSAQQQSTKNGDSAATLAPTAVASETVTAAAVETAAGVAASETNPANATGAATDTNGTEAAEGTDGTEPLDEESILRLQSKIEQQLLKYFQNKEIAKERSEENKLILEELEELFEELGEDEIVIPLPSGENGILTSTIRERDVLDVDMLANELQVPKDELKTPFDFCAFTAKGKLTPAMITKHTSTERDVKMRVSKRKATSKRRKRSSR